MYVQVPDYIQYIFDFGPFTTCEQWWGIGIRMRGSDPPTHVNDLKRMGVGGCLCLVGVGSEAAKNCWYVQRFFASS